MLSPCKEKKTNRKLSEIVRQDNLIQTQQTLIYATLSFTTATKAIVRWESLLWMASFFIFKVKNNGQSPTIKLYTFTPFTF
jgi:hypothetical protein